MTGVAGLRARDVGHRLGIGTQRRVGAAVAGCALAGRAGVVHLGRGEGREVGVAGVALSRRRYVIGRFAQRVGAVVAGRATPGHRRYGRRMVEAASRPGRRRVVTGRALRRRRDVRRRLHLGVLRQIGTAVAGRALGKTRMAHRRRRPGHETVGMTGIAFGRHRNMGYRLGLGILGDITAVVTI